MASFYIPLTGLNADSTALNTIANNLSNMNTTGFKSQTTNFSDLFYQQVGTAGSGDAIQVGSGVQVASNTTDFTGGSISSTGIATDVAINGGGFFVLDNGGSQLYTRNGSFQMSSTGTLESSGGQAVMGYGAVNGVVNTTGGLADITVPTGQVMAASATSNFSVDANLNSTAAIGATASSQVKVYDSLGNGYEASINYTKTGINTWSYSIVLPDNLSAQPATAASAVTDMAVPSPIPTPTSVPEATTASEPATTVPSPISPTTTSTPTTISTAFAFGTYTNPATGAVTQAQVDPASTLTVTVGGGGGTFTVAANPAGESVAAYAASLATALNGTGVTVSGTNGILSLTGPTGTTVTGHVNQDILGTTVASSVSPTAPTVTSATSPLAPNVAVGGVNTVYSYNFVTSNSALAVVDPATNLTITEGGNSASAPATTSTQSVASYAASLQSALTQAGIVDVTAADNNGVLTITKANASTATFTGGVEQDFTGAETSFDFGTYTDPNSGLTMTATVAPSTSLTISAPTISGGTTNVTITPSNPAGESVAQYAADVTAALAAKNVTGVTVSATNGVLSITGPTTTTVAGSLTQNMLGTTSNYAFASNSTVDPSTNLVLTGQTASGVTATITAPTVTAGETVAQYATALTSALATAGIAGVQVTATNGQLSIAGANLTSTGTVQQGLSDTTINYDFGSNATVNPATNITIVGPTVSGTPPTAITAAPTVTAGETVAQYAVALQNALSKAGIDTGPQGVSVTANGGQLSIVGPAATLKTSGTAGQDLTATTIQYNFGTSGSSIATVDPSSNLTISGLTANGATATTTAPTITPGESLTAYAASLTNALATAGIAGVTVTASASGQLAIIGANIATGGNLIQDPVASANASGTMNFNSSGNLVSESTTLSGITFAGLSDGAAPMNMNWNLYGANNVSNISQTSAASSTGTTTQNGYASGEYNGFTIGSDGTVSATYSNGQTQTVGQLAIATISNEQGLDAVGSSNYQTTTASGSASVGAAGTNGRGTLEGDSLEASNVNISDEFSELIIAQRAFEANSKAVTTFDTVTQDTISMVH